MAGAYFTYYLNADLNKYQLAGFLENTTAYNPNFVNAVDYSARFVTVKGDRLGLITDANKSPLQSLGLTGLDLLTGNTSYTAYLDNSNNVVGTGKQLFTYYYNQTKSLLQNKNLAKADDSLVGYWDMETTITSGGKIVFDDLSKESNVSYCYSGTSTLINCGDSAVSIVNGKVGKATELDGLSGNMQINHSDSLNLGKPGDSYTYSLWAYLKGNKTQVHLIGKFNSYSSTAQYPFLLYETYGNGPYLAIFNKYSSGTTNTIGKSVEISENWHFIVVTTDLNKGEFKLYVDGILSSKKNNIFGDFQNSLPIYIGSYVRGYSFFRGLIDEVRIYNRALSDDEVKALYTATN